MTDVCTANDISRSIVRSIKKLHSYQHLRTTLACVDNKLLVYPNMQLVFNAKAADPLERVVYELVVTHATLAEKVAPGGFRHCVSQIIRHVSDTDVINTDSSSFLEHSWVPRTDTLKQIIDMHAEDNDMLSSMVHEAMKLAGFAGKIVVEKTSSDVPSLELIMGYTFRLRPLIPTNVTLAKPRVVCIDGYVESVSEIHHMLESASEAHEPCVMFVRGMSDDVLHTLSVNNKRGSLCIVPIAAKFDLDSMNTLVDIAVVSGGDVVSSLKGELMSTIRFFELPIVDNVSIHNDQVMIVNAKTRNNVNVHVKHLRERRLEQSIDDVASLLDVRIRSLSPNHVVIRIPDGSNFIVFSQRIDNMLRAARSAIDHGVDSTGKLTAPQKAGRLYAERCLKALSSMGSVILT